MQGKLGEIIEKTKSYDTSFILIGCVPMIAFLAMVFYPANEKKNEQVSNRSE
jgi:hypothetical protein